MSDRLSPLHPVQFESLVRDALAEDLGRGGDLTTDALIPADQEVQGTVISRSGGVVAGSAPAEMVFRILEPRSRIRWVRPDGSPVARNEPIMTVEASTRAVLTGERTALNLLGRMSGVATMTRKFVDAVEGTGTRIVCTRKTTPGLRVLEKYAVRCGGGWNHRFGLDDAVLIKDNHLVAAGGVSAAVRTIRRRVGHMVKIQLEVDTLDQLVEGLEVGIDAVLLDNMDCDQLKRAVAEVDGRAVTEASGGVTLDTVADIARTGVDLISVGALTHSAPCLDLSLELDEAPTR
jgi:nicotinate-nucleotide pyrophosphorylase (carboxylating)